MPHNGQRVTDVFRSVAKEDVPERQHPAAPVSGASAAEARRGAPQRNVSLYESSTHLPTDVVELIDLGEMFISADKLKTMLHGCCRDPKVIVGDGSTLLPQVVLEPAVHFGRQPIARENGESLSEPIDLVSIRVGGRGAAGPVVQLSERHYTGEDFIRVPQWLFERRVAA